MEREPGRKEGRRWARLLSQLWAEHRGHGTPVCLAGSSRSQASAGDSREGVAGLRPHTTNTSPSAKPGRPNMGIRELRVNLAASCLHHAGRGGVVSTEKRPFSPETSPRVCCFLLLTPTPHPEPDSALLWLCHSFRHIRTGLAGDKHSMESIKE